MARAARSRNIEPTNETSPSNKLTITVIKADCGSLGGHTKPSSGMIKLVDDYTAIRPWIVDYKITFTGDDIAIITTHKEGTNSAVVHKDCRAAFDIAADKAKKEGLYGAGQDLFPTSSSGNVRGTGPGVAEITFDLLPSPTLH